MVDGSGFGHIRSGDELRLAMDFSGMQYAGNHPSDIDMFYLTARGALLLVEIKHERGTFKQGQKWLYAQIAQNYKNPCLVVFATHDTDVHEGGRVVDVSQCRVRELFFSAEKDCKWRAPKRQLTVGQLFQYYAKKY